MGTAPLPPWACSDEAARTAAPGTGPDGASACSRFRPRAGPHRGARALRSRTPGGSTQTPTVLPGVCRWAARKPRGARVAPSLEAGRNDPSLQGRERPCARPGQRRYRDRPIKTGRRLRAGARRAVRPRATPRKTRPSAAAGPRIAACGRLLAGTGRWRVRVDPLLPSGDVWGPTCRKAAASAGADATSPSPASLASIGIGDLAATRHGPNRRVGGCRNVAMHPSRVAVTAGGHRAGLAEGRRSG